VFDTSKLRGRIIEKFGSQASFAEYMKLCPATVSQVLNGKMYLDQNEIEEWANSLDISAFDYGIYFFERKVHEK